jgi:O-antigen/teichoic acid export membrane protein
MADDIRNRSISAFLWGAGGTALRIVIQVVAQIVLARILGPDQYGLFATALVVIFFVNLFADAGLTYGLASRPVVGDSEVRFIFTWHMLTSAAIAALLIGLAPLVAAAFGDPRLSAVVGWLALSSMITALGATANALLRRNLDFRTSNMAAVASYAIAFLGIGIPMALAGFEVMALVAAFLMQALIASAMMYWAARHPVRPLFRHSDAAGIVGFGATVLITNLVNWVMSSLDRAIVSSTLGTTATGLYTTMANLVNVPAQSALATLQPVLYVASSKAQDSVASLRSGLKAMLGAVVLFVAPVFAAVAVAAHTVVMALYGAKWVGGGVVLAPMALTAPAILLMGLSTPVLWSAGYPRREYQVQLPMVLVWAAICYAAAQSGSLALVAWTVAGLFHARALAIVALTIVAVRLPWREVPALFAPGFAVSAVTAATAAIVDRALDDLGLAAPPRLVAIIGCCGLAMLGSLACVRRQHCDDLRAILSRLGARLPRGRLRTAYARVLGA